MKSTFYGFDWDDNVFHMPTKIKMDKKVGESWEQLDVEPAEFALIRGDKVNYRIRNSDPLQAFDEFIDFGPRGDIAFLEDVKIAISRKDFGPSWDKFKHCLISGHLFAIVTSRSHEYSSIRKAIEYVVENLFTKEEKLKMLGNCGDDFGVVLNNFCSNEFITKYFNKCKYYGVGIPFSEAFKAEFGIDDTHMISIQEAKRLALGKFLDVCHEHNNGEKFSFGFSDDDKKTVELIKEFFDEISIKHAECNLVVYDTSDRSIKSGVKTTFKSIQL